MFEPLNIILRTFLSIIFLIATTKFLTKRNLSNLTYFDYITTVTLGSIAGNLCFNVNVHILNFILSIIIMTLITELLSYLCFKYKPLRNFFAGKPTILIEKGKIIKHNLKILNYSYDYLIEQLRQEKIFDVNQVECALLEPSGKLSIKLKPQNTPLTVEDAQLLKNEENLAIEIILNGKILDKSLIEHNLNQKWLYIELDKIGIKDIHKVEFAALGTNGKLYAFQQ